MQPHRLIALAFVPSLLIAACSTEQRRPVATGQQGSLREAYEETPQARTERPGKHSTTTGRHGTSGTVGGGIDAQSGTEIRSGENPVIEQRQDEERDAERRPD